MDLTPSTTSLPPASSQNPTKYILILALDDEFMSLLASTIPAATHLTPVLITQDVNVPIGQSSPSSPSPSGKVHRLNIGSSAAHLPDYAALLVQSLDITTVLLDLRGHCNELGISCAILKRLATINFAGHVVYISVSGDLLKPSEDSRALREAYPVHAAIEAQLQQANDQSHSSNLRWTIVGRSTQPHDPPSSLSTLPNSPSTSPNSLSTPNTASLGRLSASNSPRSSCDGSSNTEHLAQGVLRAIQSYEPSLTGRKIMLDLSGGRRRSFMHQTDWRPD